MIPAVLLEGVSKSFREGEELRVVLHETSASVAPGELVAVRGRSGSGKTTLLNLVAGIDSPSAGQISVGGVRLSGLSARERSLLRRDALGFVFQFFNLIPTLTALENVMLPIELAGTTRRRAREGALALLERVGLAERAASFPDRLSGGEQQRIAIARALARDPPLLLADEPTGNLDERSGEQVLNLLERATRARGKTLLLVTHSPQVAARADRVLTIEAGRVVPLVA